MMNNTSTAAARMEREQGERFVQLSQRCHQQNWVAVHALAEQIISHKNDQKKAAESNNNQDELKKLPTAILCGREVVGLNDGALEAATNNDNVEGNLHDNENTPSIESPAPLPYPAQPRMLSTCLGTASPLAWACRYSAPSATVALVLNLDMSSFSNSSKPRKKRRKNRYTPRILTGLREWRRTVRVLIEADESLMKDQSSQNNLSGPNGANINAALLSQDADGNTPLHFIVRRAAAPAFGTGRWQTRDLDEDEEDESGDDEQQGQEQDAAIDVDNNDDSNLNLAVNRPRVEYWGTSGSAWDGVRWCMEAHLRRVERRIARQRSLKESMDFTDDDDGSSSATGGMTRRVRAVHIHSPVREADDDMSDADNRKVAPTKRKSLEIDDVCNTQSSRLLLRPILGSVRDLVNSCPEAVGVPDAREYEETPLIVALKSSIYVVMEQENGFHFADRIQAGPEDIAIMQGGLRGVGGQLNGDPFPFFGAGGMLNNAGIGADAGVGIAELPLPDRPVLQHNRPFEFLPNDEALMATLRGHGRRVERENRSSIQPRLSRNSSSEVTLDERMQSDSEKKEQGDCADGDDDSSSCSSVSDQSPFEEDDPLYDAFVPSANEQQFPPTDFPGAHLGLIPRGGPRYDYQTALEYRIFCLVRIMLDAYPRASCLMISDYTPLHSAVFHGRCPDTIRLLLDAESRYKESRNIKSVVKLLPTTQTTFVPCPTLPGPAMLSTNTRGELPLHFACMRNECARTIRLLSEADPRSALVRDASGRTPLRWLWIRFVDGLLDRFGGREQQADVRAPLSFREQEGGNTGNFLHFDPNVLLGINNFVRDRRGGSRTHPFDFDRQQMQSESVHDETVDEVFVFDTDYIRKTRLVDRTVDFLRMRHVPNGFETIERVAADHAITVLLKVKYLQERQNRQLDAAHMSGDTIRLPPLNLSIKEEFILFAFEKFVALIYAAFVATEAEKVSAAASAARKKQRTDNLSASAHGDIPSRTKLWHSLHSVGVEKKFMLVHEACGCSRASCPVAVAIICMKIFTDHLYQRDDDGCLPLHRVASRGLGWEPPGSLETAHASLADETLNLMKEVLTASHTSAPMTYNNNRQLPLHCAIDSVITSLRMGKHRRETLHAEARVALQKYRHNHVQIANDILSELLQANSNALQTRDGKTGLYPFMQAAVEVDDRAVVKYTNDLSRRPGFNVPGATTHSYEDDIVEESDTEGESDHLTIVYFLLREDPSVIDVQQIIM
ncbi:hypothetical protein QTG54_012643 [Skeletonema marinoi]|uniref:Uncharacterized protein n=1 Tax=Skeletonema marinoi TaxID=267567 RepID=A0AAD8Y0C9_9STRA|nr:hypothetical protein QTG54_012643 [Skeletonema marinoi]